MRLRTSIKANLIAATLGLSALSGGCNSIRGTAFQAPSDYLQQRTLQTRRYENISEKDLLSASAGAIQDLGFNLEESETQLGVITASKDRDATEAGQVALAVAVALFGGGVMAIDKNQTLRASLVIRPTKASNSHLVRVTFQRIVRDTNGQITSAKAITQPEAYQEFFARLSKAVFLEGHKI